ncbi:MAG: transposase [Verrucomicrobiota bacterium]
MQNPPTDYDGAWKEALQLYLQPFLHLAFPAVAAAIDWAWPPRFLDTELQQITPESELGRQRADILVEVFLREGRSEWLLIHVEVQVQRDAHLARRMYQYHHRIGDRFGRPVVSLAVLADLAPGWRPAAHEESMLGCRLRFEYPTCKLLDLESGLEERLRERDPAAVLVAVHLAACRTRDDTGRRYAVRRRLTRGLYDLGYTREEILRLMRFLDWLLTLPEPEKLVFRGELTQFEKEKAMPYVTSYEQLSREEGLQQGLLQGREQGLKALRETILDLLEIRFGGMSGDLRQAVMTETDPARLRALHRRAATAAGLDDFAREVAGG